MADSTGRVDSQGNPDPKSIGARRPSANSPLVSYALSGLRRCWLTDQQRWSHIHHLDGRTSPNESVPQSDVFYTLNVLLGMSRIREIPQEIDIPQVFAINVDLMTRLPVAKYAFGMALWTAAKLKLEVPSDVMKSIQLLLGNRSCWTSFRAQDLGMLLTGIVAQAADGRTELLAHAAPLFKFLSECYATESGLFNDTAVGYRRRFASFATQTYLSIACYSYGEFSGDQHAIALAVACTRRLIALQGPQGEWPWFFDASRGEVVDFYEVYSVHQYGMAPALLEFAERHNVLGAGEALFKGFNWIFGENQLKRSMLLPALQMSYRSQVRGDELNSKHKRVIRAITNACFARQTRLIAPDKLAVRQECRSYELGWILWSFGERDDLSQLTHNLAFSSALR